jgi:enamine deaminase RidA (YjgF/YER057c/UK114 family)
MGVLEAAGSSLKDVNIFLTDMEDFTWVNEISDTYFCDPKPASKLTHSLIPAFFFNEGFI